MKKLSYVLVMFATTLSTGCEKPGKVEGRVFLPVSDGVGPSVGDDRVCSLVTVGLHYRKDVVLLTGREAPFDQVVLTEHPMLYELTVSPTYDASQHSCSYTSGEVPSGKYFVAAEYATHDPSTSRVTWLPNVSSVEVNSPAEELTVLSEQIVTKDVTLRANYVR